MGFLMVILTALGVYPVERAFIPADDIPFSAWCFRDGGSAELAKLIGEEVLLSYADTQGPLLGFVMYADGGTVHVARYNWTLIQAAKKAGHIGALAYSEGAVPPMGETIRWALAIFEKNGFEPPTPEWEEGDPEHTRNWDSFIQRMDANKLDTFNMKMHNVALGRIEAERGR